MAKEKCPPCDCPQGVPLWLGTYGDMVTLILTFFIFLLSMASFTNQKINQAIGSLEGSFSGLEKGLRTPLNPPQPIQSTHIQATTEQANGQKKKFPRLYSPSDALMGLSVDGYV